MLWPLLPVVILGLAALVIHKSRFRSGVRVSVASALLLYFVVAAATVGTRKAPYVFFALLALGVLIEEVWRRKQGMQAPRA